MKVPKDVGGVEIPNDLRSMAKTLVRKIESPVGRDAAIAGLTLVAAAVIAVAGEADPRPHTDDDGPDAPIAPEPPVSPRPPEPSRPPEPLRHAERVVPEPRGFATATISPAQVQAVADALGNVAEAALMRFLGGRRF